MRLCKTLFDLRGVQNLVGLFVARRVKKIIFFVVCCWCLQTINSQKLVKKSIVNADIAFFKIDVLNCFDLKIETALSPEMTIEAAIDGEYNKDLLLTIKEEGSTIFVTTGFQPNFINPNDKLSAHKVVSIALRIQIPEQKSVHIFGTSCNVLAKGVYQNLDVSLSDGRCELLEVSETADIKTQSGTIIARYSKGTALAESEYGSIEKDMIPKGDNHYNLHSVTGNIIIKRVE